MVSDQKPSVSGLIENPTQRTPCVLVLDASGSMDTSTSGSRRIDELNRGLRTLEAELKNDPTAKTHVQLAIVCVGGAAQDADVLMDWTDAKDFQAFDLVAQGETPLGKGLLLALQLVESQKQTYKVHGIDYTRPWIMVITDGQPTDDADFQNAVTACRAAENANKCVIYPIGVEGVNVAKLQEISSKTRVLLLERVKFVELFQWLSKSLSGASRAKEGQTIQLASTDAWAAVQL